MNLNEYNRRSIRQRFSSVASSSWTFSTLAFLVSESLFLATKIQGMRIHGPVIPMGLGLIKDLVDVAIVVLFPWHGWVFALCLMAMFFGRAERRQIIAFFFLSSASTAIISSVFEFDDPSLGKIAAGLFTYLSINLFIFTFFSLVKLAINRSWKCLR